MAEKKYCIKTETLAGFAKALGHPARIAIMKFLAKQNTCYFGDIHEELPIATARPRHHIARMAVQCRVVNNTHPTISIQSSAIIKDTI